SLTPPPDLTFLVRSELAESNGDGLGAIAWAESLAAQEADGTSFGHARVATLVARMRLRAGESEVAAQVLTPPLRSLGAPPEAYALRALAHELSRRYEAAL